MSIIHGLSAFSLGGVAGLQAGQRDWSPYLVHFTSYAAMIQVRKAVQEDSKPSTISRLLRVADKQSLEILRLIHEKMQLRVGKPAGKPRLKECVCLSECTLPGLIALSERYGRFGFVFEKRIIYKLGGRPCTYIGRDHYEALSKISIQSSADGDDEVSLLHSLSNIYCPPGSGWVQDYTHEREWRVFSPIDLNITKPFLFLAPLRFLSEMRDLFGFDKVMVPLDVLFSWGI